jgi:acetyl-CoA acetyltransferase
MAFNNVVIAGVYATRQARALPGQTSMDVCVEAAEGALADAGLAWEDVDGFAFDWPGPTGQAYDSGCWAKYTGHNASYVTGTIADSCGVRGLLKAAAAIEAGLCDVALVGGGVAGVRTAGGPLVGAELGLEFMDIWGAGSVPRFALSATRHMHLFGTRPEHLAGVAATIRNHGHFNPEAVMFGKGPYTAEQVLASPVISTPFHLLDVCIMSEGGCAIVLTSKARACDLRSIPVAIIGGALEMVDASQVEVPTWERVGHLGRDAARRAYGMAGISAQDVGVFNVYDPNSFEVIRQMEVLGLCGLGEGGDYCNSGAIALDGAKPVNTDGGLLSYTWLYTQQTTLKVVESVRQLRGTAANQVADVHIAVATNGGTATGQYGCAVLAKA